MSTNKKVAIETTHGEGTRTETMREYPIKTAINDYHRNIDEVFNGVLATICRDDAPAAGYPFTSVVPFILDKDGFPIIMAADISQHYLNMEACDKVALFLQKPGNHRNVQTQWRMTINGQVEKISHDDEATQSYFRHYPASKSYTEFHDFSFFRIKRDMVHIVQNFGQIGWLDGADLNDPCPLKDTEIKAAVEHMNADHVDSLYTYLQNAGYPVDGSRKIELVSVSHRRFVIRHQNYLYSISFPTPVSTIMELRQAMIKLTYPAP